MIDYTYSPDGWMLVKIGGTDPHYRVFGSWAGGYLDGDGWRLNSGITEVLEDDEFYYFKGSTGSVYRCYKEAYGRLTSYNWSVLKGLEERATNTLIALREKPKDVMKMDWIIS